MHHMTEKVDHQNTHRHFDQNAQDEDVVADPWQSRNTLQTNSTGDGAFMVSVALTRANHMLLAHKALKKTDLGAETEQLRDIRPKRINTTVFIGNISSHLEPGKASSYTMLMKTFEHGYLTQTLLEWRLRRDEVLGYSSELQELRDDLVSFINKNDETFGPCAVPSYPNGVVEMFRGCIAHSYHDHELYEEMLRRYEIDAAHARKTTRVI
ncbi:hypothetical protein CC80DRAFT_547816 [Byssothecium circinans]|uniref:Uncharacterized protein n=1 Tax=Byssothecium circinans TaxID=147558 RepID=A0A6A5TYF0_9PLEO|nr:hypothetical protein CC80DRAFT_547816 [Byssothecium circinans]